MVKNMECEDLLTEEEICRADQRAKETLFNLGLLYISVSQDRGIVTRYRHASSEQHIALLEQGLVALPVRSIVGIPSPSPRRVHRGKGKPIQTFYPPAALIQNVHTGWLALRLFTGEIIERKVTLQFIKNEACWGTCYWGKELILAYHSALMDQRNMLDTALHTAYALIDPRTEAVRYIGISKNPRERYRQHCSPSARKGSPPRLRNWLNELKAEGLRPQMKTLETNIYGAIAARERERCLIARHYVAGADLCNVGHRYYAMQIQAKANFSH